MAIVVASLQRNFGREAALSSISGQRGADVVLARRVDHRSDGWLKRVTAGRFYHVINRIADLPIPENVGNFHLMDRTVVDVVRALPENRRFMEGLFAWAGFRTVALDYVRPAGAAGESKFNGLRLVNLAIEDITSFSTAPLRLASYVGASAALASFALGACTIVKTLLFGRELPGHGSLISVMLFLSVIRLLALGVIGDYVGRTYLESKRRPAFVVRRVWRSAPGDDAGSARD